MNGSIEITSGTLGGGKTYFEVDRMYQHVAAGGWAYTNIEIYPQKFAEALARDGLEFDPKRLVFLEGDPDRFHERISRGTADSQVLVVIDEAGLAFNARDWAKTDRALLTFNTLARKLDINLHYISQDIEDIDKQFRRKASKLWICRNLRHYRIGGVVPFPIPIMVRICMDNTVKTGKAVREFAEPVIRRQWICDLYNSDALHGSHAGAFSGMAAVRGEPLRRIPRVRPPGPVRKSKLNYVTLCAASFASYYLLR